MNALPFTTRHQDRIHTIKLGTGTGDYLADFPAEGEIVHSFLSQDGHICLYVRHPHVESMVLERRKFLLRNVGEIFDSSCKLISILQFNVKVQAPKIVVSGAQLQDMIQQVSVLILDAGVYSGID